MNKFSEMLLSMREIQDTGKVWIRGTVGPVFAIRVADKIFVPGQEEGQTIDYWVDGDFLCVGLHDPRKKIRLVRRFDISLPAATPASLFSGFERTKHADAQVVTYRDKGVKTHIMQGKDYDNDGMGVMNGQTFRQRITRLLA
jgi:hypothetical protein